MKQRYDLSTLEWSLTGWHPHAWESAVSMELGLNLYADISTLPARVPGSVQQSLRDAGLLPDWNVKLNSRACEWVENRHWVYETKIPADWTAHPGDYLLRCEGLDYQGEVLVNGVRVGEFCGSFTSHSFDLSAHLCEGENRLSIAFTDLPRYLGQIGYTSTTTTWKTRFNYIWDWIPRLVQVGIWDAIHLEIQHGDVISAFSAYTEYDVQAQLGSVQFKTALLLSSAAQVEVIVEGEEGEVGRQVFSTAEFTDILHGQEASYTFAGTLENLPVTPWQPNGNGNTQRYTLRARLLDAHGALLDEEQRTIGFREIIWKACQQAPEGAEPWICCVNGIDTFLQGANWVPIRPCYADVTAEEYRRRLQLYHDLGFNLLRVWGGAVLETETFYALCDELGIMVWQEFSLSSSGSDNWPPEDPQAIVEMRDITTSYITRRQHHPSLLLWCGGNELQGSADGSKRGCGKPVDYTHPMIGMMAENVRQLDPTRRFLPTSSSGPTFIAKAEEFGKGIHHDVHGPWNISGPVEEAFSYWDRDDALFRSEMGMPDCSSAELIRQYGQELALPADFGNPFWMHTQGWWMQWEDYQREGGDPENLEQYVAWSQQRQATVLTYAATTCKRRFPACGGIIFWMGHDAYPCPVNTSIIDFNGAPKPAALAVAQIFRANVADGTNGDSLKQAPSI